jgi:hypothetical protein
MTKKAIMVLPFAAGDVARRAPRAGGSREQRALGTESTTSV